DRNVVVLHQTENRVPASSPRRTSPPQEASRAQPPVYHHGCEGGLHRLPPPARFRTPLRPEDSLRSPAGTDLLDPSHPLEQSIDCPAAAGVRSRLSAVAQNLGIGAASFFQSAGQDREAVEGAAV